MPDTLAKKFDARSQYPGDRKDGTVKRGLTAIPLTVVYDAETRNPSCLAQCCMMMTCTALDKGRSYLYLRNGSIESNDANQEKCCCTPDAFLRLCCPLTDSTSIEYFDRAPYKASGCCCNTCCMSTPKLEILKPGCMCCCMHCAGCASCGCRDEVILMPFEQCPCPCCCCANRVGCCDNRCGLCGPPTGNPKCHIPFAHVQPQNVQAFVDEAQKQMTTEWTPAGVSMVRA